MLGKKVILYKATGGHGQLGMHALRAEDRITYYWLLDKSAALTAQVQSRIIPKGRLGDLSLTEVVALVKFLSDLEKERAKLVRLLSGVQALRSQTFAVADALGVAVDAVVFAHNVADGFHEAGHV